MIKFNIPEMSTDRLMLIGTYAFGIQAVCAIFLFFINIHSQNFFSATSAWASIIFSMALTYFFFFTRHNMKSLASQSVGSINQDEIDDIVKCLKEDGK
ncbi:MAG: hypothetical protein WBL93_06600 [Lutisporaceae bacterium]